MIRCMQLEDFQIIYIILIKVLKKNGKHVQYISWLNYGLS